MQAGNGGSFSCFFFVSLVYLLMSLVAADFCFPCCAFCRVGNVGYLVYQVYTDKKWVIFSCFFCSCKSLRWTAFEEVHVYIYLLKTMYFFFFEIFYLRGE